MNNSSLFIYLTSKKAFSVAEAMITLLIVSVALAAAAPIMTKKAQSNTSGNSKWMFTRNGSDITRITGNVGINVPTSENPSAKLDIRSSVSQKIITIQTNQLQTADIIEIKKGANVIARLDANGQWFPQTGSPQGMISFFDRPCASVTGGWENVPTEWQGRYPRIVGNYKICNNDGSCSNASIGYNQQYDDAVRNISGGFGRKYGGYESQLFGEPIAVSGAFDRSTTTTYPGGDFSSWTNSEMTEWVSFDSYRVVPTASENRPKTVGLYMCRKV